MDERLRRVGENEALFRIVNDEVRALDESLAARGERKTLTIVCECGRADCVEHLELRTEAYEAVRGEGTHFAIKPGHETPEAEDVVERHDDYWVVEKREGGPARLARKTDPRN